MVGGLPARVNVGASFTGLTTSVKQAWEPAGVSYLPVAIVGVLQLDNYNTNNLVMLKRDIETGSLNVQSLGLNWL